MAALDGRAHGGRASVRCLHVAHVEVVIRKHRAADRADENGAVLDAELVDGARQHLVDDAVAAAGAIVRLVLQFFLALVAREERFRLAADHLVFGYSATGLDIGHLLLVGCPNLRCTGADKIHQFLVRRNIAAAAAEELHRPCAVQREADVFDQLAVAHLDHHEQARPAGRRWNASFGNG